MSDQYDYDHGWQDPAFAVEAITCSYCGNSFLASSGWHLEALMRGHRQTCTAPRKETIERALPPRRRRLR